MLEGHDLIYFGPGKWEGMWRNRHQLMSRFASHNKVMYVEPVVYFSKLRQGDYSWSDLWKAIRGKRITKIADNVLIYHSLPFVPISGRFPLNRITWWVWNLLFHLTLKRLGFSRPIIWLSQPDMSHFIGKFDEKLTIYHVVDEYLAYPSVSSEVRVSLERSEKKLLERVDLVIVVSEKLQKKKSIHNKRTFLVKNGVDYESYDKALSDNRPLPADVAQIPRPIIGYSGLISRRLDLDMIEYGAKAHPEWSMAFIGMINDKGCEPQMDRFRQMKNVHFLGEKKIREVPYYVKAFDVSIVPYMINEETENLSALKLYDFLAIGMPIVATNFPAVQEFQDVVYVANSNKNFTTSIEDALVKDGETQTVERRRIGSLNTWERRVMQLSSIIQSRLREKSNK